MITAELTTSQDKVNILMVDDRPENLVALEVILDDPTYNLVRANSGEEALRHLLKMDFALILLDIFMPGMDGYEVASIIKGRERTRYVPIIFLTAMAKDINNIYQAYSVGAVDYIQKPIDPNVVRAKVRVFAELYQKTELLRQIELREKERQIKEVKKAGESRYQELVEGINHGIVWSADADMSCFTYVSPRAVEILGYPQEQWFNERFFWEHHLYPEDRKRAMCVLKKARVEREVSLEHRFLTSDGSVVWFHTGIKFAFRTEGHGCEMRGLSVDITSLKRTEKALREAVQAREDFLSIASHELKTPITPLKLQVQMFLRGIEKEGGNSLSKEKLTKALNGWNRQLNRLAALVEALLDVSRITSGKLELHQEDVDLVELVHDAVDRYSPELAMAKCEVSVSGDGHVLGRWDRLRIEQVILNLLSNAMKYGSGKPITIHIVCEKDKAVFSVRDSGIGISKLDQRRIFNRFERAVSASTVSGLGLGLYISNQIVAIHGGRISLESELGVGSIFTVELPRSQGKLDFLVENTEGLREVQTYQDMTSHA